jgi:hypothetical protein
LLAERERNNVNERFDISQGIALWQYCQPEEYHYQKYVFNLSRVNDLRDSGLAWLRMFVKWAHREEAAVQVIMGVSKSWGRGLRSMTRGDILLGD